MVKNINNRCLAIAGAALLFLGLSGNVQANPLSMSRCLDTDISSLDSKNDHRCFEGYRFPGPVDLPERSFTQAWHADFSRSYNWGHRHHVSAWKTPWKGNVVPVKTDPVVSPITTPVSNNVPDGGITALMVAAAMSGLVYMKKKQSA